ncbi:hypothetical protein HYQ44_017893 [Verticillium longisporum]|nr:hypothetical protein HYQ44_017893 [Verticillium longisporum]
MASKILSLLSIVAAVSAHGIVTSPPPRPAGDAFRAACGNTMFNMINSDPLGNIQGMEQGRDASLASADCNLNLCKAFKFEDNPAANIQSYSPGETVNMLVRIGAPHTGIANVSVVDTTTNTIIGTPLIEFTNYASTRTGVAANNTDFSFDLPATLPAECATAGNCVLQWFWDSDEAGQTYMSCIDFTTSGTGSAPPAPAPPAASSAPVVEEPAAPTTTAAAPAVPTTTAPAAGATTSAAAPVVEEPAAPTTTAAPVPTSPPTTCKRRRVRRNSAAAKKYRAAKRAAALRR